MNAPASASERAETLSSLHDAANAGVIASRLPETREYAVELFRSVVVYAQIAEQYLSVADDDGLVHATSKFLVFARQAGETVNEIRAARDAEREFGGDRQGGAP